MQKKNGESMKKKNTAVLHLTQGAVIASLYVVLTLVFAPVSFGLVQVRVAEVLTILPMFTPSAVVGLFIGCLLANLIGGAVVWDILLGSLATLIGAVFAYVLRFNRWLVPIPAVVSNSLIIPVVLRYGYGMTEFPYWLMALYIAVGEVIGCYIFGELFATALLKYKHHIS